MTTTIMIDDKELVLTANAATSYRYRQVFHKDLLKEFTGAQDNMTIELIEEMAYIMYKQGSGEPQTANMDDYLAWLEGFEPLSFATKAAEIANVYAQQKLGTSKAKKKAN